MMVAATVGASTTAAVAAATAASAPIPMPQNNVVSPSAIISFIFGTIAANAAISCCCCCFFFPGFFRRFHGKKKHIHNIQFIHVHDEEAQLKPLIPPGIIRRLRSQEQS
jgi:hypothetical protein